MMKSCNVCNRAFTRKDNLERHLRIHTGEKPFSCSQCHKKFVQETHLKKHEKTHNIYSTPNTTPRKPKKTPTSIANPPGSHFLSQSSAVAPIAFRPSTGSLTVGVNGNFAMNNPINFRTNNHQTHHHPPPGSSILAVYRPIPVSGMDFQQNLMPPNNGGIIVNTNLVGGGSTGNASSGGSTGSGASSGCSSSSEGGKGPALSPATYLRNFCMGMSESEKFVCTVCGGNFKRRDNLERHMRAHTGEKPFGCTLCSKRFAQAAHVNKHMKAHDSDRYYPCTVCGKYFTRRDNLDRHYRIHTGEKPFNCSVCGRLFSQKEHLQKHAKSHQNQLQMNQLKLEERNNQYLAL